MKRNPNRLTHPVGAFTPKSVMRSSIVTKGRKIPIAAKIRAAARRARAASQSSSDSSGSSAPPLCLLYATLIVPGLKSLSTILTFIFCSNIREALFFIRFFRMVSFNFK